KTSILDAIRGSSIAEKEAGNITQKISFTNFPLEKLKEACPIIEKNKIELKIPGFLFIDTPGHAAFTNLRKRGGSLADIAILVIDINEGIKPQTSEVIQILKENKTPFIVVLNKIDRISGWHILNNDLKENISLQPEHTRQEFYERYFSIVEALNSYGFNAELFFDIKDFSKNLAVVPSSARTKEGIQEILFIIAGLSQKFLINRLYLNKTAKGVVLEVKKEKNIPYIESILYDGIIKIGDEIAIANFDGFSIKKVKVLQEIEPLKFNFKPKNEVSAAAGIRIQISSKSSNEEILPGMPFIAYIGDENVKKEFKDIVSSQIKTGKKGIIVKADSLGSLEALITLLKQSNIPVLKVGIGDINKSDILSAKANLEIDPINSIIIGFNVKIDEEVNIIPGIKILTEKVIYKLIEKLQKFREEKTLEIEKERLIELVNICKIEILPQYIFRNTNPAIFGVRILVGTLKENQELIDEHNEVIGKVKKIQSENKEVEKASHGMEVAISVSGVNFDRKLRNKKHLYSNISERQIKKFEQNKDLFSSEEMKVLNEIKNLKKL
ncbi:MAG: translation initiation factor IF-2, partial [Candidatus Pacearchaeota archaeon]